MKVHPSSDFLELELSFPAYNESYLKGSFGCDGKRTQKTHNSFRERQPDALRWHLSAPSLLDSDWFQESGSDGCSVGTTEQPLQRWRTAAGDHLSDHSWSGKDRDDAPVASQWCLSILERSDAQSECHNAETLSAAHRTTGLASVASAPRSLPEPDECPAPPTQTF